MSETLTQIKNSSAYVYIGEYIRKRKQYKKNKSFLNKFAKVVAKYI